MAAELHQVGEGCGNQTPGTSELQTLDDNSYCRKTSEIDETITGQSNLNVVLEGSGKSDLSFEINLQPEKVVEVFSLPDGSKSYRVQWKDTWIHEQLIAPYQHLVDYFWACNGKKESVIQEQKKVDFEVGGTVSAKEESSYDTLNVILVQQNNIGDNVKKEAKEQFDEELNFDEPTEKADDTLQTEKQQEIIEGVEGETKSHKRKTSEPGNKRPCKKIRGRPRKSEKVRKIVRKEKLCEEEKENKEEEENKEEDDDGETMDDGTGKQTNGNDKKVKRERYVYTGDKGPCTCNICGKVISNKYGLREHQTVVHFKNGRFQCDICGKRVTNKRALNLHMTSHSNERKFVCDQCGSSHKTKGNLNYHIKTMHTTIKNFRCDICFKTFKVQAELKEHCFSVHANAGVITCIVCKKKLTTSLSIYTHSVMHSGAREHECGQCGYAFKTSTGLKEHQITHSADKPVRQCPYCERKFFSRSQYNAHVMRHTADGSLITYKCPICEVKFQHKSSYNRHVIRHQPGGDLEFPKENPYLLLDESELPEGVCHKCRKYYSSKSGFYLHLKKCRDGIIQQFQCPYCERGCSNRSSLKRHIQRRHKGMEFEGQTIHGREILQKEEVDSVEAARQAAVITPQDGIQYQGTNFEYSYGNQITSVEQLTAVDVQLLIDTAAAAAQGENPTHILSSVGQDVNSQNLHILSENEAAQFAAQLTQHGVIVRSTDVSRDQGQEQQLIVSSAQIDARTGQIIVSENQAAQILANAEALRGNQLENDGSTLTLQTGDRNGLLRDGNVIHFNNRTAVIQIQHNPADTITNQQVLTISEQQLQESGVQVAQLQGQNIQDMNSDNIRVSELQNSNNLRVSELQNSDNLRVSELQNSDNLRVSELQSSDDLRVDELQSSDNLRVTELQRATDINEIDSENIGEQQFIQEEQIVSNLTETEVENAYNSINM